MQQPKPVGHTHTHTHTHRRTDKHFCHVRVPTSGRRPRPKWRSQSNFPFWNMWNFLPTTLAGWTDERSQCSFLRLLLLLMSVYVGMYVYTSTYAGTNTQCKRIVLFRPTDRPTAWGINFSSRKRQKSVCPFVCLLVQTYVILLLHICTYSICTCSKSHLRE